VKAEAKEVELGVDMFLSTSSIFAVNQARLFRV
jgi:hypothetical protein